MIRLLQHMVRLAMPAAEDAPKGEGEPQLDSVKLVADLAVKAFADQNDRLRILDTRSGMLLSACSAVIGFLVTLGAKPPVNFIDLGAGTFAYYGASTSYFAGLVLALLQLFRAEYLLIYALRARDFPKADAKTMATDSFFATEPAELYASVAETYAEMTERAAVKNKEKVDAQLEAMTWLICGLATLAVLVLLPVIAVSFGQ